MTTEKALKGKPYARNPHVRFDEREVALAITPRRGVILHNKNHKVLMYLASLWVTMVAYQGKATEPFRYDSADSLGKIKDMVLSSDNKMFALQTTGAKIQDTEYPVWVGNTKNLGAAFSSSWMTNATSSCAFFKDKLYLAPKAETNYLYCVDVGTNHIPNVKSAKMLKFDAQGLTKMKTPYLYATTYNLHAIEDTSDGVRVHSFIEYNKRLHLIGSATVNSLDTKSIKAAQIKDIVSRRIDGEDYLYILTTNTAQTANLWLVKTNSTTGECITPKEWSEYNSKWEFTPLFDHTTSIAVHKNMLLSANANYKADGDRYEQLGWVFLFQDNGKLLPAADAYRQSDTFRTSAIGSDQKKYYAEAINHASNSMDSSLDKYFLKGDLKFGVNADFNSQNDYPDKSFSRQGSAVHKFITRKEGEIFSISPDRIYHIRDI